MFTAKLLNYMSREPSAELAQPDSMQPELQDSVTSRIAVFNETLNSRALTAYLKKIDNYSLQHIFLENRVAHLDELIAKGIDLVGPQQEYQFDILWEACDDASDEIIGRVLSAIQSKYPARLDALYLEVLDAPEYLNKLLPLGLEPNPKLKLFGKQTQLTSLLHYVIEMQIYDVIDSLIAHGANINAVDWQNNTPAHLCALKDLPDFFKSITSNKCQLQLELNSENKLKQTPLMVAILNENYPMLQALLQAGASLNPAPHLKPPLICAIEIQDYDSVRIILNEGGQEQLNNSYFATKALVCAVIQEDLDIVHRLLLCGAQAHHKVLNQNSDYFALPAEYSTRRLIDPLSAALQTGQQTMIQMLKAQANDSIEPRLSWSLGSSIYAGRAQLWKNFHLAKVYAAVPTEPVSILTNNNQAQDSLVQQAKGVLESIQFADEQRSFYISPKVFQDDALAIAAQEAGGIEPEQPYEGPYNSIQAESIAQELTHIYNKIVNIEHHQGSVNIMAFSEAHSHGAKQALQVIFKQLLQLKDIDPEAYVAQMTVFLNGFKACETGQAEAIDAMYQSLITQDNPNEHFSFEQKIKNCVWQTKQSAARALAVDNTDVHGFSVVREVVDQLVGLPHAVEGFQERYLGLESVYKDRLEFIFAELFDKKRMSEQVLLAFEPRQTSELRHDSQNKVNNNKNTVITAAELSQWIFAYAQNQQITIDAALEYFDLNLGPDYDLPIKPSETTATRVLTALEYIKA